MSLSDWAGVIFFVLLIIGGAVVGFGAPSTDTDAYPQSHITCTLTTGWWGANETDHCYALKPVK